MKTQDVFKCEECGATFRDGDALEKHRRVHQKSESKDLETGIQEPLEHPSLPPSGFNPPVRTA